MSSPGLPTIRAAASGACSHGFLTFSAGRIDMLTTTKLRVARPTDDLEAVAKFYREGLGFTELYRFADHDGFDGVMLGLRGAPYHPDAAEWQAAVTRFQRGGYEPVRAFNPYWDRLGLTFEDPDGYRVVLQRD